MQFYDNAITLFFSKQLDWVADTVKVALLTSGYVFNPAHQYVSSLNLGSNGVGTPITLTGKTFVGRVADADDGTFVGLTGSPVVGLAAYKDTGNPATSPLIFYDDSAVGFPYVPNGTDTPIEWDNGDNKIFRVTG